MPSAPPTPEPSAANATRAVLTSDYQAKMVGMGRLRVSLKNPDGRVIADVYGDTVEEAQGNARLVVNIYTAIAQAEASKVGKHAVGTRLRVLVNDPEGAELSEGDIVTVEEDPDKGGTPFGEPLLWVKGPDGTNWGLNPDAMGTDYEVYDGV
jgi:hypothetical protein